MSTYREDAQQRGAGGLGLAAPLFAALRFLTAIPIPGTETPEARVRSAAWFPAVGLLLGVLLAALDAALARLFPPALAAGLLVAALALLTGGLHLEGLADTADGLFGGHSPEERLRIMREPTIGAYGAIAVALVLLLKTAAIAALDDQRWRGLLLFPALGRWSMVWAMGSFPYARVEGLGTAFRAGALSLVFANLTVLAAAGALLEFRGLVPLVVVALASVGTSLWMLRRLPGLTGDCYGALGEMSETAALLAFVALPRLWP